MTGVLSVARLRGVPLISDNLSNPPVVAKFKEVNQSVVGSIALWVRTLYTVNGTRQLHQLVATNSNFGNPETTQKVKAHLEKLLITLSNTSTSIRTCIIGIAAARVSILPNLQDTAILNSSSSTASSITVGSYAQKAIESLDLTKTCLDGMLQWVDKRHTDLSRDILPPGWLTNVSKVLDSTPYVTTPGMTYAQFCSASAEEVNSLSYEPHPIDIADKTILDLLTTDMEGAFINDREKSSPTKDPNADQVGLSDKLNADAGSIKSLSSTRSSVVLFEQDPSSAGSAAAASTAVESKPPIDPAEKLDELIQNVLSLLPGLREKPSLKQTVNPKFRELIAVANGTVSSKWNLEKTKKEELLKDPNFIAALKKSLQETISILEAIHVLLKPIS